MHSCNLEQEESAKPNRCPKNFLEYAISNSINDNFFPLLAKHHKNIKDLLKRKSGCPSLNSAIFIINLNNFSSDLEKISRLCDEICVEVQKNNNTSKAHNAPLNYSSEDLARDIGAIYRDARYYDEHFGVFQIFRTKTILPLLFLFTNPFTHNPNISNEENILNLLSAFKIHDYFIINYLNTLYGDEEVGEAFTGRSFELISADYKKIKDTIIDISKITKNPEHDKIIKNIKMKCITIEKTIEKYPATLYLATKNLLLYLESHASPSLT